MDIAKITALVRGARQGEPEARSELCRETYDMAYYTALRMVGNPDDALDIVQESYLRAFAGMDRLKSDESFVRWLSQIVSNLSRDALKKKKPALFAELRDGEADMEPEFEDDRAALNPQGSLEDAETRRLVAAMVDALPEDQRLCVMMYYYNELSVAEIAAALEVSENTVKSRLRYAREKVRAEVLALERTQGVRLYGLAPIPLLMLALRAQAAATPLPAAAARGLLQTVAAQAAASAGAGAATGAGATAATAGTAGASAAAGTAAGTAAKAISAKLIAGILAGAVAIGGGVYAVVQMRKPSPAEQLQAQIMEGLDELGGMSRDILERSADRANSAAETDAPAGEIEPAEPELLDPVAMLEVEFSGLSGLGEFAYQLDDPTGLVVTELDTRSGGLRNGDLLEFRFRFQGQGDGEQRADYLLSTHSHTVVVDGLLEPPLSLDGVDHAELDAQMLAHCLEMAEKRYPTVKRTGSLSYSYELIPRTGYYAVNPDNPADNVYVTCYDLPYTNSNGSTGMSFLYVSTRGVFVENGILYAPRDLHWNQIGVYKDGAPFDADEALDYLQRTATISAYTYVPEAVEPQA